MEFSTNNSEHLKRFNSIVGECFIEYAEEYTYFKDKEVNQHFAKIQKTDHFHHLSKSIILDEKWV